MTHRWLPRAAVGAERGEPLRSRSFETVSLIGAVGHAGQYERRRDAVGWRDWV